MVSPLLTARPSAGVTRRLLGACAVIGALAVVVALTAGTGRPTAAEPACIAIGCVCAALVAHMLHASARPLDDGRLVWMSAGVTVALAGLIATALGMPILFGAHAPASQQADAMTARYLVWHAGLLCAAVLAVARVAPRAPAIVGYAVAWAALLVWTSVSPAPFGGLGGAGGTFGGWVQVGLGAVAVAQLGIVGIWWRRALGAPSWGEQCVIALLLLSSGDALAELLAGGPYAGPWWASLTLRAGQFAVPAVGLLIGFIAVADKVRAFQDELAGQLAAERERAAQQEAVLQADADRRERARGRIQRLIGGEGLNVALQPIVDLDTRRVAGVEALARFTSPDGARLPTEACFLEAHAVGLGPELELAVIRLALSAEHRMPEGLYLALNVSPQLLDSAELDATLAARHTDRQLVVELTEHQAVEDYVALGEVLERLRGHGIRIAVDDVGSGFSSFRHVTRINPDILKLDRTLVSGIDDDPVRQSLASAIVSFARDVGATVVSEGIESHDELICLQDLAVACGQGFYLARPNLGAVEAHLPEALVA
jgi:EAL domain-containing protein (putative c-di-GMP-specific phosphodiesterase class I)